MINKIIEFSINKKLFVGITILFLILGGIYSMMQIPVDAVPDITNNQVQVVTTSPSLAPQEMEIFITYPIEVAMANIPDVIEIRSISRYGLSVVTIVFKDNIPILNARQLVNEQIQLVGEEFPEGLGKPQLMPITTGLGEIYQYTLEIKKGYEKKYSATELRTIQDWIVKRQLSGIQGIVEISSFGGYLKQYEVAVDPQKLKIFKLTTSEIFEALANNNQNTGGSYIEKYNNAFYIRAEGLIKNLKEIEQIVICSNNETPILIKDVATVRFGKAQRFGAMTKNGKGEAIGGITLMLKGANSSAVIKKVKKQIAQVQNTLPEGVYIKPYLDRSVLVAKTIRTVIKNLLEGGLIVILILILLLGNIRAGAIVASVIPLSMLFAFIMMHIFGVSANLMSLGAIDFGIVIDGAVIIVESIIHSLYANNKNKILTKDEMNKIVSHSTHSIYKSAIFGVIIILIVFLPIITLVGIEGKTFKPMAQTVSFAIIGALLLSITYVPMMSSIFLSKNIIQKVNFSDKVISYLKKSYSPILHFALNNKYKTLGLTIIVFILSIWGFTRLGGEFIPTLEEGDLAMQMTIPPGSSLTESIEISTRAENVLIKNFPEVKQVISKIGTAEIPTDPMAIEDADIMIILDDKKNWISARSREELVDKMKEKLTVITGATFDFTQPIQLRFNELMTGAKTDIAVKIYGENMNELSKKANQAASIISKLNGAADVKIEQIEGLPQLVIKYDRKKIARHGLNIKDLNTVIRTAYAGETAGFIFEGEKKFDLVIRFDKKNREKVNLENLFVKAPSGNLILVSEVASLEYIEGPIQISRDDTKRRIIIGINVRNRDIQSLVKEIDQNLKTKLKLLPGYTISYGGQFENLEQAKNRLSFAVPVALSLILLLLFFTFNSIKYALLIFSAVPLSAIGGITALWVRDMPFSISAGIGFIALFGVAVLNGIVLIGYFNSLKTQKNMSIKDIVIQGTILRLRPVMMTASVAAFGFLPMALSTSAGAEVQKPLATVVIGGLITSTMLTMIILPILYYIFNSPIKFFNKKMPGIKIIIIVSFFISPLKSNSQEQEDSVKILQLHEAVYTAINNNPLIKNAELQMNYTKKQKQGIINLKPIEINFQKGQINSNLTDQYWEVNQNLGSLLTHIQKANYVKQLINLRKNEYEIILNQLSIDVKSAYYYWLFQYNKFKTVTEQHELYKDFLKIANLKFEHGESNLLEKTIAETKYSEIQNQLINIEDDLEIAENKLLQLMATNEKIIPPTTTLNIYEILPSSDSSSERFSSNQLLNYHKTVLDLKHSKLNLEKSNYFPEISVGYFYQNIQPLNGLRGWNIGLSFPLWFFPQNAKIQQAKVEKLMQENHFSYQKLNIQKNIENLEIELNKNFSQLMYYRENALKQADILIKTATIKFQKEDIDYMEYIQSISTAIKIKLNHLETLNSYNQTAIKLEFYTN